MTLNSRAIALQGVGYPSRVLALAGFYAVETATAPVGGGRSSGGGYGGYFGRSQDEYPDPRRQRRAQILAEDKVMTDLIVSLITNGVMQ